MNIPGLVIVENLITPEEEYALMNAVDCEPWNTTLSRRTQHYGYVYNYKSKVVLKTKPIPDYCDFLIERLLSNGILTLKPDQMIINEYEPGQGISPHVDDVRSFADGIVSISLGSNVTMDFTSNNNKVEVPLPRRSVVALFGQARYEWKHGIAARKFDNGEKRSRRISLTFRKMKLF